MSGLLERAVSLFVAPPGERPSRSRSRPTPAPAATRGGPSVMVLGAPADAVPVARLLGTELRLRTGASCVLLAEWRGGEPPSEAGRAAPPAARRLAERLAGRGIEATASGRTVHVPLPVEPAQAAATHQRAVAAAGVPTICALAGARPRALDPLLDEQDLIVVAPAAGAAESFADLVLIGLHGIRAPVVVGRPVPRGAARFLAASSVATARTLGAEVTEAIRGLA